MRKLIRNWAAPGELALPGTGATGQYDDNGIDLSLIRANMRLTASERAARADRARRAALRVQQIGREARRQPA